VKTKKHTQQITTQYNIKNYLNYKGAARSSRL